MKYDNTNTRMEHDFLIYSYFGKTFDQDAWEDMVSVAVDRSYRDATNQGAYNAKIESKQKEASVKQKEIAKNVLKEALGKLFSQTQCVFDVWHKETCDNLVKGYKEKKLPFAYGNAQKWINMAVKYIYILYKCGLVKERADAIKYYMGDFHIPIDSYILDGLKIIDDHNILVHIDSKPWSKWDDYDKYSDLQKEIIKKYKGAEETALIWENKMWLDIADYRKTPQKEKKVLKEEIKRKYTVS